MCVCVCVCVRVCVCVCVCVCIKAAEICGSVLHAYVRMSVRLQPPRAAPRNGLTS